MAEAGAVQVSAIDGQGRTRDVGPGHLVDPQCVLVTGPAAADVPDAAQVSVVLVGQEGDDTRAADDVRRPAATPDLVAIHLTRPASGPLAPWPVEAHGLAEGLAQILEPLDGGQRLHIVPAGDEDAARRGKHKNLACLLFGGDFCLSSRDVETDSELLE